MKFNNSDMYATPKQNSDDDNNNNNMVMLDKV